MFSFLADMGNYEVRKVGRFNADWGFISTAKVSDGAKPYETAILHKNYTDEKDSMVIVEAYNTREEAEKGHEHWVKTMTTDPLPEELVECGNSEVAQLAMSLGANYNQKRKTA